MSKADPDGRIAQIVSDRLACLGIAMSEALIELRARLDDLLPHEPPESRDNDADSGAH